ncbi:LysR family transcriptional regulator [Bacillus paralicheniformis]
MDIENMKAFVSVAELRSISAAAIKLNHLQSNMTAKIKKSKLIIINNCLSEIQKA